MMSWYDENASATPATTFAAIGERSRLTPVSSNALSSGVESAALAGVAIAGFQEKPLDAARVYVRGRKRRAFRPVTALLQYADFLVVLFGARMQRDGHAGERALQLDRLGSRMRGDQLIEIGP